MRCKLSLLTGATQLTGSGRASSYQDLERKMPLAMTECNLRLRHTDIPAAASFSPTTFLICACWKFASTWQRVLKTDGRQPCVCLFLLLSCQFFCSPSCFVVITRSFWSVCGCFVVAGDRLVPICSVTSRSARRASQNNKTKIKSAHFAPSVTQTRALAARRRHLDK